MSTFFCRMNNFSAFYLKIMAVFTAYFTKSLTFNMQIGYNLIVNKIILTLNILLVKITN